MLPVVENSGCVVARLSTEHSGVNTIQSTFRGDLTLKPLVMAEQPLGHPVLESSQMGLDFPSILNQATGGNPFTYSTPSNVTYGEAFTNNFGGTGLEQFPAGVAADFAFTLINTGNLSSQDFFVHGVLESASGGPGQVGIVAGIPQSQTRWRAISLVSTSGPAYAASPSNDPVTGSPSLLISPVIGGSLVNVWIERVRQIPAPGTSNQITGFIADVPEPGTVALLVGCGISGGLFMRRKRRA